MMKNGQKITRRVEALEKARFRKVRVAKYLFRRLLNNDLDPDLQEKFGLGTFLPAPARELLLELYYNNMRKQKRDGGNPPEIVPR